MLAVGGVVAEVRNGKNTAKKGGPTHLEGTASKGNTSGGAATGTRTAVRETREDTTGQDMERNRATETNSPAAVLVVMERYQVGAAPP